MEAISWRFSVLMPAKPRDLEEPVRAAGRVVLVAMGVELSGCSVNPKSHQMPEAAFANAHL